MLALVAIPLLFAFASVVDWGFEGEIAFAMVPLLTSSCCDDVDGLMMVVVVDWRVEFDAIDDVVDDDVPVGGTFG